MKDPKQFAKAKKISMDKDELVREHKHLVGVLRSPSHKDDKKEADKQAKELKEYEAKKADVSTRDSSSRSLARRIIAHNRKKLHKSVDFKDTLVSVDAKDQLLAEKTASPELVSYIQNNLGVLKSGPGAAAKIPFPTGMLTLTEREAGIYHGHFQDRDGQVVEKFDSQTVAIIAKTMQIKELVPVPAKSMDANYIASEPAPAPSAEQQMVAAAHDRIDMVHNRIDELQRQVINQVKGLRIKYGDFELEIRKSVQGFVSDFKAGRTLSDKDVVRKALTSWRKHSSYLNLASDQQAAKELAENWDQHQDSFCQFVDAITRGEDEQN